MIIGHVLKQKLTELLKKNILVEAMYDKNFYTLAELGGEYGEEAYNYTLPALKSIRKDCDCLGEFIGLTYSEVCDMRKEALKKVWR